MRRSRKSKRVSALCCGFLNESCLGCACGWEVEASDELHWEQGLEGLGLEQRILSLSLVGGRGEGTGSGCASGLGKVEGKARDAPSILIRPGSILAVPSSSSHAAGEQGRKAGREAAGWQEEPPSHGSKQHQAKPCAAPRSNRGCGRVGSVLPPFRDGVGIRDSIILILSPHSLPCCAAAPWQEEDADTDLPLCWAEQEVKWILGEGNLAGEQGCHEMNVLGIACVAAFARTRAHSCLGFARALATLRAGAGQ